jgi:hypothetical protein
LSINATIGNRTELRHRRVTVPELPAVDVRAETHAILQFETSCQANTWKCASVGFRLLPLSRSLDSHGLALLQTM